MKPIQTGLASYGMSGAVFHAPFLDIHPMFAIHTIVERTSDNAHKRYPYVRIVRSYDDMLDDPDIQLVIVNTPDVTHYEFTRRALVAGKHVIVEKPFVFTVAEGEALIALAEEKGLMLAVYQNRRWDGDFLTIRQILQSGVLGRVVEFQSSYQRYRNYIQPDTWKEKADRRVGLTYNLGSHMIDQAVTLFGIPKAVYADIDSLRKDSEVDDFYHIQLIYEKLKVSLRASYLVREEVPRYYIHGTQGSYVKCGLDPQEEMLKAGISPGINNWGAEKESAWGVLNTEIKGMHFRGKIETLRGNYAAFYNTIYQAFLDGTPPPTIASAVLPVIRIIEAAFQSAEDRKAIDITCE
ncbi:MAG: Gfo/Idh/MocA family oxidoreductase [Tannerellaceae bacterium]|jgi:predicted dehydrogenase|nr:Gfo/Idh/MocA family oxidoreductase [Tannerellaceae bacterium]